MMQAPLHHFWFVQATHTRESDYCSIVGRQKLRELGSIKNKLMSVNPQVAAFLDTSQIILHNLRFLFLKQGLTLTVAQAGLECPNQLRLQVGGTTPSLPSQIFQSWVLF